MKSSDEILVVMTTDKRRKISSTAVFFKASCYSIRMTGCFYCLSFVTFYPELNKFRSGFSILLKILIFYCNEKLKVITNTIQAFSVIEDGDAVGRKTLQ